MPALPVPFAEEADEDFQLGPDPMGVPFIPETPSPTPAPTPELTEDERKRAIKRSRLQLESATDEVERLKPSLAKLLSATGLNIREGAVGSTKQTVGNLVRSWTEVVAPTTPHQPGSFKSFLQIALRPYDPSMGVLGATALAGGDDPESAANVLRQAGVDIAASGTEDLRKAAEETEQLGGGPLVQGAGTLASSFGASAPALLAGPGGLLPLALASGLTTYGSAVEDFKAKLMERHPELSEQQAFDKAMVPAAASAAAAAALTRAFGGTERFIDQIVTRQLTREGIKNLSRDVFKAASLEFPEEWTQQFSQGLFEKAYVDPEKKIKDIFDESNLAALSGFALGGVTTGTLGGVVHTGAAVAKRAGEVAERSRLRRDNDLASSRRIQQVVQEREAEDALQERKAAQAVRDVPDQTGQGEVPITPGPAGVSQRALPRAQVPPSAPPVSNQDVVQEAVNRVFPPALPKTAMFGGYLWDNPQLPSYKIPGIRPGLFRDVSPATARQLGYSIPDKIPTFEEWNAAGRPATSTPEVSFSPNEPAGVPPDMQSLFQGQNVQQIATQMPTLPPDAITSYPGGITKFMHDLGSMARTPEDVAALRQMAEGERARGRALMKAGDFDAASLVLGLQHSEAYEFATGESLDGKPKFTHVEQKYPGYVPPVPSQSYLTAKTGSGTDMISKSAAGSTVGTVQQLQAQAAAPIDWQEFSYVDKEGYRVINESKLRAMVEAGQVRGGTASEALLLHFLQQSDLHPLKPIRLIDMTPEQITALAKSGLAPANIATKAAAVGAYKGLFSTETDSPVATIEIVTRENDGRPITQQEFVRLMVHELGHNNVTSKLKYASPALQKAAHDLFMFFVQKAQGTVWESHNASKNVDEFFSEAFSTPGFQKFLAGLDYTGNATTTPTLKESVWGQVLGFFKRILKLPDFITTLTGKKVDIITALDEAFNISAQLEQVQRRQSVYELSPAPGGPPPLPSAPAPVTLSQAQVAAGTAEIGRIADAVYKAREQAGTALEGLSYERQQYRTARNELNNLRAQASVYVADMGADELKFPDPRDGVKVGPDGQLTVDDQFVSALTVASIPHDPARVQSQQAEVWFEAAAHRYNNLGHQIETLQDAMVFWGQHGAEPKKIAAIDKEIAKLIKARSKLAGATLDDRTVLDRAGEMTAAEDARQTQLAKRDALSLEPVVDFFGSQVGGYRTVLEKVQAGLAFANAAADSAANPEAAQAAMAEASKWHNVPTDVRNAILAGKPLTDEQRASIFATLAQSFEEFDYAAVRMRDMASARIPEINTQIRDTLRKVADGKVDKNITEEMLAEVMSTISPGLRALRERTSAIGSFARFMSDTLENNEALFYWLLDPTQPQPLIPQGATMGADRLTVDMILAEASRNPDFAAALVTLIEAHHFGLTEVPLTAFAQIDALLKNGSQENQAAAESLGKWLYTNARSKASLASASMRDNLHELDKLEIERRALQEGQAMFKEIASSPDFGNMRQAVSNSQYGLVEPMHEQNHTETAFKPFGFPGLPSHAGLKLNTAADPQFKSEWFKKVWEWQRLAKEYVNAYDVALAQHQADPQNNPSPQALGFDLPKVRGLRDATDRAVPGAFLDVTLNSENKRWKVPWLTRQLSKLALFRQHDFVAKMVGGQTGFDLRQKLSDFTNHYLISQGIREDYRDIPDKTHQALLSHPEFQMNLANYREHWNEMAHLGRIFGSPLKAGVKLPRSGRTVTAEDMALLQRQRAYEEALRRRVTETNVTQGVRVKTPTRTLVRPGAYVGDEGLPRFPGRRAESFIGDVLAAYAAPRPPGFVPNPNVPAPVRVLATTANLGTSSTDPLVQFWNRNMTLLVQHILDVNRLDRQMQLTPAMQAAERDLHDQWIVNGVKVPQSMDELVTMLVGFYPTQAASGINPRDAVIRGLDAELRQYRDAANRIAQDRAEQAVARQASPDIAFSADNEFTRPAAKLELPSPLYDYGALTPGEHLTIASRANHERIVAYATAVNRAIVDLQDKLFRYNNPDPGQKISEAEAARAYGGNIHELKDVLAILQKIQNDFKNAYAVGSFSGKPNGIVNDTLGLLTAGILAMPTVGLRNMTQGQMAVYAMSRAMGNAGHIMTAWRALKAMPRTLTRFALHLADGLVRRSNVWAAMLTGQNRHMFEDMVGKIGNAITGEDFRAVAEQVRRIGLDSREDFLQRLARIWQESGEFMSREDMDKSWKVWQSTPLIGGRKVRGLAAVPFKAMRAFFDKMGVQQYDFAINTAALNNAEILARRLKEVALEYGRTRESQGLGQFDPTDPRWQLKPNEWSSANEAHAEDSLNTIRLLFESSVSPLGFQLESSMWNWYQRQKAGQVNPPMFTPPQMEALQRRLLADFNASTPANRPSAASANNVVRNLLLLQGYPSDLLLKLVNSGFGKTRDRGAWVNATVKAPVIAALALMAILIGYMTSAVTGTWEKYARGRMPSLATPVDADFWTSWKRWAEGTLALGSAQFGYIGDIILGLMGEVRGNRGFDPTGRILAVSLVSRALNSVRGAINTTVKGAGTLKHGMVPLLDTARSMVPFWLEVENVLGKAQGPLKQSERVRRGEAMTQGLIEGRSGFIPPTYGPTTVVRRSMGEAIGRWGEADKRGDVAGAARELEKAQGERKLLFDYHYNRYLAAGKDAVTARTMAERDVWNDYQDINPAVAALLGRRPTAAQEELVLKGITGQRRRVVDHGDAVWKAGSMALFGRPGVTTKEAVAANRGGGGGGGGDGFGFRLPGEGRGRFQLPGAGGLGTSRRVSVPGARSTRSRIRRSVGSPAASVRRGVRSVRRSILGPERRRRAPAVTRAKRDYSPPNRNVARRQLGSRRRREYAGA